MLTGREKLCSTAKEFSRIYLCITGVNIFKDKILLELLILFPRTCSVSRSQPSRKEVSPAYKPDVSSPDLLFCNKSNRHISGKQVSVLYPALASQISREQCWGKKTNQSIIFVCILARNPIHKNALPGS